MMQVSYNLTDDPSYARLRPGDFEHWPLTRRLRYMADRFTPEGAGLRLAKLLHEAADQIAFAEQFRTPALRRP